MKRSLFAFLVVGFFLPALAPIVAADEAKDEAISKDRKTIEGTWKIIALEVNGNKAKEEDARKLTAVNGSDGTWKLRSEEKQISEGTSVIDPTQKPKTIDFHADRRRRKG